LTEPKFTKAELVEGLLWCREGIENLLPVYDKTASLSSLLEAETRDDKADNVIQWDEFTNKQSLATDKRLKRSIAAWGKVNQRMEVNLQQRSDGKLQRDEERRTSGDRTQDQVVYQQLLDWATHKARLQLVSNEYLNNPESSKRQSAFLSKSTFTAYALKQLVNKLIDDGTDWFLEFGKLREKIDHRFPGHGLSLENTEGR
jgi:hypothetical protein